jgi:Au+-exporting ATPase
MNSLVALGSLSAFGYSLIATLFPALLPENAHHVYYESAAVTVTWILLGRYLEARAKVRTSEAIARIARLAPDVALLQKNGNWVEVKVREVVLGDVLLVRPGARIPADGKVLEGESHVDESMLTGEPMPVVKQAGMQIHAGTVNQMGSFSMQVNAVGAQTMLAQIQRMVEQAQASKLPIQALADQVTRWFVPAVLGLAALTALGWYILGPEPKLTLCLVNAINVLIIACPCALGLATPTSILVGTGRGAELGLLFRQGEALERLQEAKVVALDKTGTLTLGRPELTEWFDAPGYSRAALLPLLAALESRSEHPIARAIVDAAKRDQLEIPASSDFVTDVGSGVRGIVLGKQLQVGSPRYLTQRGVNLAPLGDEIFRLESAGNTVLALAVDTQIAAVFSISDPVRPEATAAVQQLKALGLKLVMLTGDGAATAQAVAARVGIETVRAELLPAGKVAALQQLRTEFGSVAFVGDGINDAPVLAEADVGIAVGAGTDVALEAADVILMRDDLTAVPTAISLSRATLRNIRQNLFWAFAYNTALIPIAAGALYPKFGLLLSPMFGALAMALSSVFVLGNALRLRGFSMKNVPQPVRH